MWDCNKEFFKSVLQDKIKVYSTDKKYIVNQIFEDGELKGFLIYFDTPEFRSVEEAYYVGNNKFVALKFLKWAKKGAKVLRIVVLKKNIKMVEFYKRIGFYKINENDVFLSLERKGGNSNGRNSIRNGKQHNRNNAE
jgi:hypothetical protein